MWICTSFNYFNSKSIKLPIFSHEPKKSCTFLVRKLSFPPPKPQILPPICIPKSGKKEFITVSPWWEQRSIFTWNTSLLNFPKTGAPVNSPLLYFVFYQCVYTFNFLYWVTAVQQFTENHRATIFVNYVCVPILHCAEAQIRLQRSKFSAASGRESLPHTRRRRQPLLEPSSPASPTTSCLTLQPRVSSTRTRVNYNELFYIFHQSPDPSPQGSSLGSWLTFEAQEPITGPRTLWVLSDRLLAKKK